VEIDLSTYRLRTDDESGATEILHAFREGGNASDKSSEELETLSFRECGDGKVTDNLDEKWLEQDFT
jgi:hypothetical protein